MYKISRQKDDFTVQNQKNKITISLDVQSWVYGWWWEGSGGWKVEREGFSVVFLDVLTWVVQSGMMTAQDADETWSGGIWEGETCL